MIPTASEYLSGQAADAQVAARMVARRQWEDNCDYLLDRYFDNAQSLDALNDLLRRLYPNNAQAMLDNPLTLNLVRKIVDTRAKLYKKAPIRRLLTPQGQALAPEHAAHAFVKNLYRRARVNARLKWATRLMELLNSAVIWGQIDWRTHEPVLAVLPPHHLLVDQDPVAPSNLKTARAIYVPVGGTPDSVSDEAAEIGYVRYRRIRNSETGRTHLEVTRLDVDFLPLAVQPPEWRGYAELTDYPFVLLHKDECIDAELFPDVPHSLILASRWLDHELTRGALNSRQTDFPAYVYNGTPQELGSVNPATGAGTIICLGDDDKELKRLSVDPREEARNRNLIFFLKLFAQVNHITPSAFTFDVELLSGTAKFHDKQPEIEYREDLIDILNDVEREELWPMLRDLAMAARMDGASDLRDLHLSIEFGEPVIPLSREEELRILESEIKLGLRSPAEVLAERRGIDLEQAKLIVAENLASQATISR
jgi:hypothetical protein